MSTRTVHAVTGAYGYSGKYIAQELLDRGRSVITLTNSTRRGHSFGDRVPAFPFHFDEPQKLIETLRDVRVLYNTYWVRFNHKSFTQADAVRNVTSLFEAAKAAGVERIVHVSITNPSEDSPLEYFRGKARLERALRETGVSHAILRPTVLFGKEDILINNIAWVLRRFPIFGLFGKGNYRLQPIAVDDLAKLAVDQGEGRDDVAIDAIGPETFTYRELVQMIARAIGKRRPIVAMPRRVARGLAAVAGRLVGDVIITRGEIDGLMSELLYVDSPPAGSTRLSDWVRQHADSLGRRYASELARRRDRTTPYQPPAH